MSSGSTPHVRKACRNVRGVGFVAAREVTRQKGKLFARPILCILESFTQRCNTPSRQTARSHGLCDPCS